ncbi:GIY-YIG nuclease family protein [Verrucomicrobiota bacterium]
MSFAYTYVLLCADGDWYIGSTDDLCRRVTEHGAGEVTATKGRRPVDQVCYEACQRTSHGVDISHRNWFHIHNSQSKAWR